VATGPKNRIPAEPAAVFTAPAEDLTEAQIAELKTKYGLDLRIKSHITAIDDALRRINEVSGYDRTHPGYDRSYDKAGAEMQNIADVLTNPIVKKPR
jgi:hypothetical protein